MANNQIIPAGQATKTVLARLREKESYLKQLLPKYLTVDRWLNIITTAIMNNPKILQCSDKSLYSCIFAAARLGLECDGITREAYLIPYNIRGKGMTLQLIPGYHGYLKLMRNSGLLEDAFAQAVWSGDEFDFEFGTKKFLRHKTTGRPPEKDELPTAFWAQYELKGGGVHFDVMWPWEINRIRDSSPAYRNAISNNSKDTPWILHYPEQGKKTVLIRVSKVGPRSIDMQRAIRIDEQAETDGEQTFEFMDISAEEVIPEIKEAEDKRLQSGSGVTSGSKLDKLTEAKQAPAKQDPPSASSGNSEKFSDTEADPYKTGELK